MSFSPVLQTLIGMVDTSHVGEARRAAARLAEMTELNETDRGKVAIITTELANNLIRHGTGGVMIIRVCGTGIEILAIDRAPGMSDVNKCMVDGFSTSGTPGTGLGAVRRLSTEFDIFSSRPGGTVTMSRVLKSPIVTSYGVVCVPVSGETLNGDNWGFTEDDNSFAVLLADGLGHGPLAAKASDEAVRIFDQDSFRQPGAVVDAAHAALRTTRGAAIAVARCTIGDRKIRYAGVGNITGSIIAGTESRGLFSHNGTVGLQIRKIQEFDYDWALGSLLIMHSDGLQSRWDLSSYPGLAQRHPAVIAAVLYRDFHRERDDVTVAVVR
jgi:anti-sigma regulatory factor (Ser/Thr protein kinase)